VAVRTGDSVKLKLWFLEKEESYTFSRSLPSKRRKKRKRKRVEGNMPVFFCQKGKERLRQC
jgi:hypothetical protein